MDNRQQNIFNIGQDVWFWCNNELKSGRVKEIWRTTDHRIEYRIAYGQDNSGGNTQATNVDSEATFLSQNDTILSVKQTYIEDVRLQNEILELGGDPENNRKRTLFCIY